MTFISTDIASNIVWYLCQDNFITKGDITQLVPLIHKLLYEEIITLSTRWCLLDLWKPQFLWTSFQLVWAAGNIKQYMQWRMYVCKTFDLNWFLKTFKKPPMEWHDLCLHIAFFILLLLYYFVLLYFVLCSVTRSSGMSFKIRAVIFLALHPVS